MRNNPIDRTEFERLDRIARNLQDRVRKLKNASVTVAPLHNSDNFPQDAVEGQVVIADAMGAPATMMLTSGFDTTGPGWTAYIVDENFTTSAKLYTPVGGGGMSYSQSTSVRAWSADYTKAYVGLTAYAGPVNTQVVEVDVATLVGTIIWGAMSNDTANPNVRDLGTDLIIGYIDSTGHEIKKWSKSTNSTVTLISEPFIGLSHVKLSPDGQWVAYRTNESAGAEFLPWRVRKSDGTGPVYTVAPTQYSQVIWHSVGHRYIYTYGKVTGTPTDRTLYVIDTTTGTKSTIKSTTTDIWGIAGSPDGTKIAFAERITGTNGAEIKLCDPDGSGMTTFTDTIADVGSAYIELAWSPDGTQIVSTHITVDDNLEFFDVATGLKTASRPINCIPGVSATTLWWSQNGSNADFQII